ncbi:MAG: cytochrome c3 family protein [Desulfuromonadales bacterium]|nr:cytochrome c3 family protein [Desulfuromonadales bacterium]
MSHWRIVFSAISLLILAFASSAFAEDGLAIDPATCLGCHSDKINMAAFAASAHGRVACTSCHTEITDLAQHMKGETKPSQVACIRCHAKETTEYNDSVHFKNNVRCVDCHTNIHILQPWGRTMDKRVVVAVCLRCHTQQTVYQESVHGQGVAKGNQDSASCADCHNLHAIQQLIPGSREEREFTTKVCVRCHADEKLAERNGFSTFRVTSYMNSFHGRYYRLGVPEQVAGCADCHTGHTVFRSTDPRSTVNPANLVATCSRCHKNASLDFAKTPVHANQGVSIYGIDITVDRIGFLIALASAVIFSCHGLINIFLHYFVPVKEEAEEEEKKDDKGDHFTRF